MGIKNQSGFGLAGFEFALEVFAFLEDPAYSTGLLFTFLALFAAETT